MARLFYIYAIQDYTITGFITYQMAGSVKMHANCNMITPVQNSTVTRLVQDHTPGHTLYYMAATVQDSTTCNMCHNARHS